MNNKHIFDVFGFYVHVVSSHSFINRKSYFDMVHGNIKII